LHPAAALGRFARNGFGTGRVLADPDRPIEENDMVRPSLALALLAALVATGCSSVRRTDPARTATEQLLISTAADRATAKLDLEGLKGKKVALVDARFESYDKPYVISLLEDRLLRLGALVVKDAAQAEWAIEIRSGALSVDHDSFLIGIPEMALPIPFAGAIPIPELAFFKRDHQQGIAKLAWTARIIGDGRLAASAGPEHGVAYMTHWSILTVGFTTQDVVPEED
jgi:hypothetical protein